MQSCPTDQQVADVISANDYYPFGMIMPGRSYQGSNSYRYGFNGMEGDDELKGNDNSYDFGARMYDPRISRFSSVDPRWWSYPAVSPYNFAADNPVFHLDVAGEGPGRTVMEALAKAGDGTFVVETWGSISMGFVATASKGMAVDKEGNVALFYAFGLGGSTNGGVSAGVKVATLPGAENVLRLKGNALTLSTSVDIPSTPLAVGGTVEMDGDGVPLGVGVTLSVGVDLLPATLEVEWSKTTIVGMTKSEFDKVEKMSDGAWTRAYNKTKAWNTVINSDENIGIWQVASAGLEYKPVKGKENIYEAVIQTNWHFSPTSSDAREVNHSSTENTGVFFRKDDAGNLVSSGLETK